MANRIVNDPQSPGDDLPVEGAVDTLGGTGTTKDSRPNSRRLFPELIHAVDQATGHFLRLIGKKTGTVDGHEVGELTVGGNASFVNSLAAIFRGTYGVRDIVAALRSDMNRMIGTGLTARGIILEPGRQGIVEQALVRLLGTKQGHLLTFDIGMLLSGVQRKYIGIDAGAYVAPAAPAGIADLTSSVTFTGVNVTNLVRRIYNVTDDMVHTVVTVVDPAGGAVGTLTVTPAIPSANAVLRIPFSASPFAWNSATDATQTLPIAACPKGVNGPAALLSNAALAEAAGPYHLYLPVSNYDLLSFQIYWAAFAGDTYQWDILARLDDQAAGDWVNINTAFTVNGTALGGAANAGLTMATTTFRRQFREIDVQRTKVNNNGVANIRTWAMVGR